MNSKSIVVAPTRIDLAGGTLDIWPLYLYFDNPCTINLAISIYAKTKIDLRQDNKIVIISIDQKKRIEFASITALTHNHSLGLITKILSFFKPARGLTIECKCDAPAGAGLAGSSALNISLCYALNKLMGKRYNRTRLQFIAKNIEAQVLKVPSGEQDYYPALYGGLNLLSFTAAGIKRVSLKIDFKKLRRRILIVHSGTSRNSGINNWEIYKKVIEGDKNVIKNLNRIAETSRLIGSALNNNDFERVGNLIAKEWNNRKKLWAGVATPRIEKIIAYGKKNGAMSAKVCGAGGGGCILFYSGEGELERLKNKLINIGIIPLDFFIDSKGVRNPDML